MKILERVLENKTNNTTLRLAEDDLPNYLALSGTTEGYTPRDLNDLVGRAVNQAAVRWDQDLRKNVGSRVLCFIVKLNLCQSLHLKANRRLHPNSI